MPGMLGDEGDRLERLSLLPHPRGMLASEGRGSVMGRGIDWADWIAPDWLASLSQAVQAPRAAYQGADVDERDALNVALNAMGGGMLAGRGPGFGANKGPWEQLRLPLRRAPEPKGPVLYHGSTERRRIIPDPQRGFETRRAAFLTDNEDVAYTFTLPREYGEAVMYDSAGRELQPGRVTALHARLRNPKVISGAEAQKFVDDSAFQQRVVDDAIASGHDGVIAQGVLEGIGERYSGNVYAVFNQSAMLFAKRPKAK